MSYKEFIWFLLSEEDKATNRRYTLTALHTHTHTHTHIHTHVHTSTHTAGILCTLSQAACVYASHHLTFPMLHSIEHWFHCLDIDGNGCLSLYEMEQFYSEMVDKMKSLGIEGLPLADCMCQVCVHGQLTPHEHTYIHTHSPPPPMVHHKCIGTFALLTPLSKVLNVDCRAVCTASVGLSVHVNWL